MNLSKIKFVICDVDGTLTDGGMYITSEGGHMKRFNAKDGMATKMLQKAGYEVGIVSHSLTTEIVHERGKMLGLRYCYVGTDPKLDIVKKWIKELDLSLEEVAFLGDDINDIPVMEAVGVGVSPADASEPVRKISQIVLNNNGGDACLREFVVDHLSIEL